MDKQKRFECKEIRISNAFLDDGEVHRVINIQVEANYLPVGNLRMTEAEWETQNEEIIQEFVKETSEAFRKVSQSPPELENNKEKVKITMDKADEKEFGYYKVL